MSIRTFLSSVTLSFSKKTTIMRQILSLSLRFLNLFHHDRFLAFIRKVQFVDVFICDLHPVITVSSFLWDNNLFVSKELISDLNRNMEFKIVEASLACVF